MTKLIFASGAALWTTMGLAMAAIPATAGMGMKLPAVEAANPDAGAPLQEAKRRKPRVPGGSGCDSVRDRAEHPECRT